MPSPVVLVERQQVARTLATELPAARYQLFQYVTVADLGAHETDAPLTQGQFDRHVGHQGADRTLYRQALCQAINHHQVKQFIAVV